MNMNIYLSKLFVLPCSTINSLYYYYVYAYFILMIFFALSIIIKKNPIVSVLYLISLFFVVSVYLASIGLTFIALSYLLVYVGAVSILFLFILMLIDIRISELYSYTKNSLILAFITSFLLIIILSQLLPSISTNLFDSNYNLGSSILNTFNNINYISTYSWESNVLYVSHISSLGNILYTNCSILLLITALILLLAMVGAIIITLNKNDNSLETKIIRNNNDM